MTSGMVRCRLVVRWCHVANGQDYIHIDKIHKRIHVGLMQSFFFVEHV